MIQDPALVSVITIFLNEERFLEEAIQSVFQQSYTNWELLLVDNGSADASTRLAQRYADEDPDVVRYLEHEGHPNRGMSTSHNLGIRHAAKIAQAEGEGPRSVVSLVPMWLRSP